jgi:hypothetical protein
MATEVKSAKKAKTDKKRFLGVDVWRTHFGPISVRAIYDVYAQKFNVEPHNMKNYKLTTCINALRKLEDPSYEAPQDVSHETLERVY